VFEATFEFLNSTEVISQILHEVHLVMFQGQRGQKETISMEFSDAAARWQPLQDRGNVFRGHADV
jgi:hypothetical protein